MMDEQQQQRVDQAAEQFADAYIQAQRAAADRGMAAQELNAQLTQEFFNRVIENLRTQAEDTRELGRQLAGQQQRATEAGRTLTQESVSTYMDFVNSMFSAAQLGGQAAERGTREAQRTATEAAPERQAGAQLPLEDYDSLTVEQISERLDDLSAEHIRQLRAYEAENKS